MRYKIKVSVPMVNKLLRRLLRVLWFNTVSVLFRWQVFFAGVLCVVSTCFVRLCSCVFLPL